MVGQQWPDVWHAMPQKASSGPEFHSDHFILGLPLRHDVCRRHFRLRLRMEPLDVPSKRQTFQLAETSRGGNERITSALNDVLVVLVARWGAHREGSLPESCRQ